MQNLRIDADRLWTSIMTSARIGGTAAGGINRLTLSDNDRIVRDWFSSECKALGCAVHVDRIGNMFAVAPGARDDLKPIAIGSHLDTQPTGGKFDGVLGVLAGLEALRTLKGAGYQLRAPLVLVNWTNEEGSRFSPAMLGSGTYAGVFSQDFADSREDQDGITLRDALKGIGYDGTLPLGEIKFAAMFELHIEQGPILEEMGSTIGVVTGVQGIRWYDISVFGTEAHAGSTPMRLRRDALAGSAEMMRAIKSAAESVPDAVATIGALTITPGSRNVIPGRVDFTLDLRHPDDAALQALEDVVRADIDRCAKASGLTADISGYWTSPAVRFDADCIAAIRHGAAAAGQGTIDLVSGAGHDAVYVSYGAPTAMIFVPCAGGLSHNELESTSPEECAAGAQVLLNAVLHYDATNVSS